MHSAWVVCEPAPLSLEDRVRARPGRLLPAESQFGVLTCERAAQPRGTLRHTHIRPQTRIQLRTPGTQRRLIRCKPAEARGVLRAGPEWLPRSSQQRPVRLPPPRHGREGSGRRLYARSPHGEGASTGRLPGCRQPVAWASGCGRRGSPAPAPWARSPRPREPRRTRTACNDSAERCPRRGRGHALQEEGQARNDDAEPDSESHAERGAPPARLALVREVHRLLSERLLAHNASLDARRAQCAAPPDAAGRAAVDIDLTLRRQACGSQPAPGMPLAHRRAALGQWTAPLGLRASDLLLR